MENSAFPRFRRGGGERTALRTELSKAKRSYSGGSPLRTYSQSITVIRSVSASKRMFSTVKSPCPLHSLYLPRRAALLAAIMVPSTPDA